MRFLSGVRYEDWSPVFSPNLIDADRLDSEEQADWFLATMMRRNPAAAENLAPVRLGRRWILTEVTK